MDVRRASRSTASRRTRRPGGHGPHVPADQGPLAAHGDAEHAPRRPEQPGEGLFTALVKPLWARQETEIDEPGAKSCSHGSSSTPSATTSPERCQAASASCSRWPGHSWPSRAGHARRADGRSEPGTDAVAARTRPAAPRRGHDRALRRARHADGATIADWVVVMAEGKIVAEGPPRAVMENPAVVDAYLGAHHDTDLGDESLMAEDVLAQPRPRRPRNDHHRTRGDDRPPSTAASRCCAPTSSSRATSPASTSSTGATSTSTPASWSASSVPTAPASRRCSRRIFGLVHVRTGSVTLGGEDITNLKANALVARGVGFVPQNNNVFPSLTVEENLQMGVFLKPGVRRSGSTSSSTCSRTSRTAARQRAGLAVRRRASDGRDGPRAHDGPEVLLLDEPSAGLSPVRQDEIFIRTRKSTGRASRSSSSSRTLGEPSRSATEATSWTRAATPTRPPGGELMHDPKVVELYLGTLAADESAAKEASGDV